MRTTCILCLFAIAPAGHCWASLVLMGPLTFAAGAANATTLLTINTSGSGSGCVGFIGGSDVTGLAACPGGFTGPAGDESTMPGQTATRTIAELATAGVSSAAGMTLVVQPPGGALTLEDLALVFFDPATHLTFTATLPGTPLPLPSAASGYAFTLDPFEAGLAQDFFASGASRIGAALTVSGAGQGSARLFLAPASGVASAPEPATVVITAAALIAVALRYHVCRRRACDGERSRERHSPA